MRTALPDQGAFNRGPATLAGFARSTIDPKEILVVALRINPVNGRAVVLNTVVQRRSNCFMQHGDLAAIKLSSPAEGMEPSPPERFVRINIAHPGNKRLIQQQRLEPPGFFGNEWPKAPQRKIRF